MGENKGGNTKERRADKERAKSQEGETDGIGQLSKKIKKEGSNHDRRGVLKTSGGQMRG